MRIGLVVEQFNPTGGGAERSGWQIARALADRDQHVHILAGRAKACDLEDLPSNITVEPFSTSRVRTAFGLWRFSNWVRERLDDHRFDVSLSLSTLATADVLQPRAGIYRFLHRHAIAWKPTPAARLVKRIALTVTPRQRTLRALERRTLADPAIKHFAPISRFMADQIIAATEMSSEVAAGKITVIKNGAMLDDPVLTDPAARQSARRRLRVAMNIDDSTPVFIFPANDPWRKGLRPLAHGFARLADHHPEAVLLIVGALSYRMLDLLAKTGIRSRTRMLGPTRDLTPVLAAADVMVLPSFYDPASKVVIEALTLGLPVIASARDGSADWITEFAHNTDPPPGLVVENPADIDQLAAALAALCDPQKRRAMAAAAANITGLEMTRHVDQLLKVLTTIATPAPASASASPPASTSKST